ncbi:MAG: L-threonine dehydratase catabolic TdcB [Alphaproteobacteria bacterium ADurb.Bin438]|nr:MAG: L-threonine dehydratase catabolic TdcB [Alphaproteobacteria bacterium ADurb.Bin438]
MLTLDKIYQAAHVLKGVIRKTDLIYAPNMSEFCDVYLKTENLQVTGSFKVRGAYFKMSRLTKEEREKGVIACSAGNHAQGIALAAQKNGIKSTIFLPSTAPISKIEATKKYGAEIKLVDNTYDDAYKASLVYQKETGGTFIHPFDDDDVIAGQATIALELMEQNPDLDAIVVPVGGGGLISGIAYAIKSLNPRCKVYGVEAAGAPSMIDSIRQKKRSTLNSVSTFADGIAVKCPGELTFDLCSKYVDDIISVSEDEIAAAILRLMEQQKIVAEGAGAVSVAAVLFNKLPLQGKKVCAVVSGGNIDVNILSKVIHRGLLKAGRRTDLTIELLDKPGQLKDVSTIIANMGANVTRVNHNLSGENTDINDCCLDISLETRNHEHLEEIKQALKSAGYKIIDRK